VGFLGGLWFGGCCGGFVFGLGGGDGLVFYVFSLVGLYFLGLLCLVGGFEGCVGVCVGVCSVCVLLVFVFCVGLVWCVVFLWRCLWC